MIKKIFILLLFCFLFINGNIFAAFEDLDINAKYYGVYMANNLESLYESNSDQKVPIASITKIMTAIVCIENIEDLNQTVVVNLPQVQEYYNEEYSIAGLRDGQKISYYDLVATMLIPSGADSAACIALNVFGDYSQFIEAMNQKAKEIGMNNTSFANPIGADDPNNYSTVYDVALMMKYAVDSDIIKELMSTYEYTTKDGSITVHNALFVLANLYGIDVSKIAGGKTGMTGDAGYCLASYSNNAEDLLICIVLGCDIRRGWLPHLEDSQKIYNYIDQNYEIRNIVSKGDKLITLPTYHSTKANIQLCASDNVSIYMNKKDNIEPQKITVDYIGMNILTPENKKGDVIGKVHIYYDNIYIGDANIVLEEDVPFSILSWSKDNIQYILIVQIFLIGIIVFVYKKYFGIVRKKHLQYLKHTKI